MDTPPLQKKGLGPLAWVGIGCGSLIVLAILAFIIAGFVWGGKIKQFAEDAQKNPTRTTAAAMVTMSGGQFEMVAEDDENLRYTVREKKGGKLTTIYWDAKKQVPEVIEGDFSAIPTASEITPEPKPEPAPEPAQN
jgi:hypothetical protein